MFHTSILTGIVSTPDEPESMYRDCSNSHREMLSPAEMMKPKTFPRVLLVDDDPTFGKIMKKVAMQSSVNLTYCQNITEFSELSSWDYDVIVMDYDLGAVTGFELTSYLENMTKEDVPVVLVSQTKQKSSKGWPCTIREFVHKSLGPFAVLDAVFEAHEVRRIHKEMTSNNPIH